LVVALAFINGLFFWRRSHYFTVILIHGLLDLAYSVIELTFQKFLEGIDEHVFNLIDFSWNLALARLSLPHSLPVHIKIRLCLLWKLGS